ncbi:MAG TPA: hypothetical protein VN256_16085 [Pyrinomonadaceae bacterium]|nr:hypothetical protein [Pyrinomonadaceae bacterium]
MNNDEIFDGFAGRGEMPESRVREDVVEPENLIIKSETDRKMARLLALHSKLRVKFRSNDLSTLDDQTKEALLQDMYDVLGVTPLK